MTTSPAALNVLVFGPRGCGKSSLAKHWGGTHLVSLADTCSGALLSAVELDITTSPDPLRLRVTIVSGDLNCVSRAICPSLAHGKDAIVAVFDAGDCDGISGSLCGLDDVLAKALRLAPPWAQALLLSNKIDTVQPPARGPSLGSAPDMDSDEDEANTPRVESPAEARDACLRRLSVPPSAVHMHAAEFSLVEYVSTIFGPASDALQGAMRAGQLHHDCASAVIAVGADGDAQRPLRRLIERSLRKRKDCTEEQRAAYVAAGAAARAESLSLGAECPREHSGGRCPLSAWRTITPGAGERSAASPSAADSSSSSSRDGAPPWSSVPTPASRRNAPPRFFTFDASHSATAAAAPVAAAQPSDHAVLSLQSITALAARVKAFVVKTARVPFALRHGGALCGPSSSIFTNTHDGNGRPRDYLRELQPDYNPALLTPTGYLGEPQPGYTPVHLNTLPDITARSGGGSLFCAFGSFSAGAVAPVSLLPLAVLATPAASHTAAAVSGDASAIAAPSRQQQQPQSTAVVSATPTRAAAATVPPPPPQPQQEDYSRLRIGAPDEYYSTPAREHSYSAPSTTPTTASGLLRRLLGSEQPQRHSSALSPGPLRYSPKPLQLPASLRA